MKDNKIEKTSIKLARIIEEGSEEGIALQKAISKYADSLRLDKFKNITLPTFNFPTTNIDNIYNKIKEDFLSFKKINFSDNFKEKFGLNSPFYKEQERFNEHIQELSLVFLNFQEKVKSEFKNLPKSSETKTKGIFEYNLTNFILTNIKLNNIKEIQNNLKNKLDRNKTYEYKESENIQMAYQFANNLNDCFLYFNHLLINIAIILGDKSPSLYGAKEDEHTNIKVDNINQILENLINKNEVHNLDELNKIKDFLQEFKKKINDHVGADGKANNVQKIINKVIENEKDENEKQKLKSVKNYFSVLEVIIRNFYSHGWLDIFPLISLQSSHLYPILNLGYNLDEQQQIKIHVNIFNDELYEKSLDYLSKQKGFEKMIDINNDISHIFENYTLDTELARSFLRKISNSCGKSIQLTQFPEKIIIYSKEKDLPNIILSEDEIFNQMNVFLEILNNQTFL